MATNASSGPVRRNTTLKILQSTKNIGFAAGICFLINGMTGPGLVQTTAMYQSAGWILPTFCYILFAVVSGMSVLFIMEAMQKIPGNKHFQGVVEYATLFNFYFDKPLHITSQFLLYGALMSNAVQCIVLVAQSIDNMLVDIFKFSWGVSWSLKSIVVHQSGQGPSPFNDYMILTLGLLVVLAFTIPFLFLSLGDNINLQFVFAILSGVIVLVWLGLSARMIVLRGFEQQLEQNVPLFSLSGVGNVMGPVLLNLAFTQVVPSWVNLKRADVKPHTTITTSLYIATALYILVGFFPAVAFSNVSDSIIPPLTTPQPGFPASAVIAKISAYAYTLIMLLPGIPVFMVVQYDNFCQNQIMGKTLSGFMCFVLPWIAVAAIPLQTSGVIFGLFLNWTSAIFVSAANFILPFLVYLRCHQFRKKYEESRELTPNQRALLRVVHQNSKVITDRLDQIDHLLQPGQFGTAPRGDHPDDDKTQVESEEPKPVETSPHKPSVPGLPRFVERTMTFGDDSSIQGTYQRADDSHAPAIPFKEWGHAHGSDPHLPSTLGPSAALTAPRSILSRTPSPGPRFEHTDTRSNASASESPVLTSLRFSEPVRDAATSSTDVPARNLSSSLAIASSYKRPQQSYSVDAGTLRSLLDLNLDEVAGNVNTTYVTRKRLTVKRSSKNPARRSTGRGRDEEQPDEPEPVALVSVESIEQQPAEAGNTDATLTANAVETVKIQFEDGEALNETSGGKSLFRPEITAQGQSALNSSRPQDIKNITLGRHPEFRSPFFRAVPEHKYIQSDRVAIGFMVFSILVSLANLCFVIQQTIQTFTSPRPSN